MRNEAVNFCTKERKRFTGGERSQIKKSWEDTEDELSEVRASRKAQEEARCRTGPVCQDLSKALYRILENRTIIKDRHERVGGRNRGDSIR